jgi:hypothetical protein
MNKGEISTKWIKTTEVSHTRVEIKNNSVDIVTQLPRTAASRRKKKRKLRHEINTRTQIIPAEAKFTQT